MTGLRAQFPNVFKLGILTSNCKEYKHDTGRKLKRNLQIDEGNASETVLSGSDPFLIDQILPIINCLYGVLDNPIDVYILVYNLFGVLMNFKTLHQQERYDEFNRLQIDFANDLE